MKTVDLIIRFAAKLLFTVFVLCIMFPLGLVFFAFVGRGDGPKPSCISNEKQLGLALTQYMEDYDEKYPPGTAGQGVGWAGQIYSYIKQPTKYLCPNDKTSASGKLVENSYGINSNTAGVSEDAFDDPGKTVMLFEVEDNPIAIGGTTVDTTSAAGIGAEDTNRGFPFGTGSSSVGSPVYRTGNMGHCVLNGNAGSVPRHDGQANYLASDGHATWEYPTVVSPGQNQSVSNQSCGQNLSYHSGACTSAPGTAASVNNKQFALTFSLR